MHVLGNGRHLPTQLEQMELYFITGEDQQMKAKTIRSLNLIRLVPDNVHIKCTVYYYYCALWVIACNKGKSNKLYILLTILFIIDITLNP
jgi:hypothetical protein